MSGWLWRIAFAPPLGFAVYAAASHVALLAGWALPVILLPVAFLLGCALAMCVSPTMPPWTRESDARVWKAVPWLVAVFLLLLVGTVTYGAVATSDREWDGLVSWGLRAHFLAPPADLSHPFFSDPEVYAHSVAYPLLQPLCLGGCQAVLGELPGRLFFPGLFVAFLALVAGVARHRGLPRGQAWVMVLAFGATPMWYSDGSGAVDSGYAELLLGYFLAVAAAGLVTRRAVLVATAAFCLPLIKPEGLPYVLLLGLVTALGSDGRRLHGAATVGLVLATGLWLPLQARLLGQSPGLMSWALPLGIGLGLVGLREVRLRAALRVRTWLLIGGGVAVLAAVIFVLRGDDGSVKSPLLGEFQSALVELPGRFADLPTVLAGYLQGFLFVRKFGLLFPMLLLLLCFRRSWTAVAPDRQAAAFFLGGIVLACLAIFLGASTDWDHLFKSRFDRLLLQWVGVGWLILGPWLGTLLSVSPSGSPSESIRPPDSSRP